MWGILGAIFHPTDQMCLFYSIEFHSVLCILLIITLQLHFHRDFHETMMWCYIITLYWVYWFTNSGSILMLKMTPWSMAHINTDIFCLLCFYLNLIYLFQPKKHKTVLKSDSLCMRPLNENFFIFMEYKKPN